MRIPSRSWLVLSSLLIVSLAACGAESGAASDDAAAPPAPAAAATEAAMPTAETFAPPAILADLAIVETVGPSPTDAGRAPTFEWRPVAGAASYRLTVLAPDGPTWAWHGDATSVRYGGVPEGVDGPSLQPGSWWSVSALDGDDGVLGISGLRPVSPGADPGIEPSWRSTTAAAATSAPAAAEPEASVVTPPAAPGDHVCDLLSGDEITAAIKGTWLEPEETSFGPGAGWCDWTSEKGSIMSLSIGPAANYDPDGWGADRTIDDLGSKAYRVEHGWDRRIGFVQGDLSVMLLIDYTKVDPDGFESLARLISDRMP